MKLTKIEIQQMLREMQVDFNVEEPYENLKNRLQKEHHTQWLKSAVTAKKQGNNKSKTIIIRRKKNSCLSQAKSNLYTKPKETLVCKKPNSYSQNVPDKNSHPYEDQNRLYFVKNKPTVVNQKIQNNLDKHENLYKTILKRSKKRCELCNKREIKIMSETLKSLKLCYIIPSKNGGTSSRKNLVALCPDCKKILKLEPNPKILKKLKLKARERVYTKINISRKTNKIPH